MIKEIQANPTALNYCNAFTVSAVTKIVYERWEIEKRKLPEQKPPSTAFAPPEPLIVLTPEQKKHDLPRAAQQSAFYQTVWGNKYRESH